MYQAGCKVQQTNQTDLVLNVYMHALALYNFPPMNNLALSKCGLTEAALEYVPLEYLCEVLQDEEIGKLYFDSIN